jgi:hypothetical protein
MSSALVHYQAVGPAGRHWTEHLEAPDLHLEPSLLDEIAARAKRKVPHLRRTTRAARDPESAAWGLLLDGPRKVGAFWIEPTPPETQP